MAWFDGDRGKVRDASGWHGFPVPWQATKPNKLRVMKYTVVLELESDGGFVASVPVLPGCISQGDSRDEALVNIREAIELYVEDCVASGDPVPEEDSIEYVEVLTGVR